MDERDPGILGNLPHSRPGRRSQKRATGQRPPKRTAAAEKAAARAVKVEEPRPQPQPRSRQATGSSDPISGAVKLAGHVAATGVQLGTAVAREVLRRLPGPW